MKLLENAALENLAGFVKANSMDFDLDARIESYSCKMVSTDKREWRRSIKSSEEANELQPLSPPEESFLAGSPFGRLRHSSEVSSAGSDNDMDENGPVVVGTVSRRTLFNLVAVLNLGYSDYDFSRTKSERFSLVMLADCMSNVNSKFGAAVRDFSACKADFWRVIDEEIKLQECIIYSYIPEYTNDPFTEDGCIWTFNYLCWNKFLKRILFLSCRALRPENLDVSSEQLWVEEQ